jgi:hypothetical protein
MVGMDASPSRPLRVPQPHLQLGGLLMQCHREVMGDHLTPLDLDKAVNTGCGRLSGRRRRPGHLLDALGGLLQAPLGLA